MSHLLSLPPGLPMLPLHIHVLPLPQTTSFFISSHWQSLISPQFPLFHHLENVRRREISHHDCALCLLVTPWRVSQVAIHRAKLGMVIYGCHPRKWRQKNQGFKASPSYTVILRLAWATCDMTSKTRQQYKPKN